MHNCVKEILEEKGRTVYAVAKSATVIEAVREMNEHRIGSLIVMEGTRIVGIFSERDVLVRVVADGLDPVTTSVGAVMTPSPFTANLDTRIVEVMRLMTHQRHRHIPIVEGSTVVGLVSIGDITKWLLTSLVREVDDLSRYVHGSSIAPPEIGVS